MDGCIFCKILRKEIPAKVVFENENLVVIEDIAPVAPLHLLLIPRRHIVNCLDLQGVDSQLMGEIFLVAAQLARDRGVANDGFRIVNNNNAGAGQSVFHIHFHLLAGRPLGWPPG